MAKALDNSAAYFARAKSISPGGVHSPVRAFTHVDADPIFIESASGSTLHDVDGNHYLDFCMAFGPLILGHNHSAVNAAAHAAINDGWSFGTAERYSLELAEFITQRIKWVESIRFVNSGTEAVMSALRLARAATGRTRVLKFSGCYHGHVDAMLVKAGSGMATRAESAGIPEATLENTVVAPLDDAARVEQIFATQGDALAAVIIEPVPANYGLLPQRQEFLELLARLCNQHGVLLIFDEVITGFRLSFGGAAEHFNVWPDIVTWGKIIGGGFPVGAYAASTDLMQRVAPLGDVYQAGTLSANPLAMRAGLATLEQLADGQIYNQLEALGTELETKIEKNPVFKVQRCGSLFWTYKDNLQADSEPFRTAAKVDELSDFFAPLFATMLGNDIYIAPSPYEVGFLSAAHTSTDIVKFADALNEAAKKYPESSFG